MKPFIETYFFLPQISLADGLTLLAQLHSKRLVFGGDRPTEPPRTHTQDDAHKP